MEVKKIVMKQTVSYMVEQANLGVEEFQWRLNYLNCNLQSEQETHFTFKPSEPIQLVIQF